MTKDQLLSLWNADNWEVMSCGVYFTAHRADKELHINCNDYTEAEILAMPFWERLAQELDELDRQAHEILQKEFPDDEDIPDLPLTDITIYSPDELERLDNHIEKYFGKATTVVHEFFSEDIHVDVSIIPPHEEHNYYTLVMAVAKYWFEQHGAVPAAMSHDELEFLLPAPVPEEKATLTCTTVIGTGYIST